MAHGALVIIDNFNVFGSAISPEKADTPLVVDADRHLSAAIALQRLKAISRRKSQIGKRNSRVDLHEFPQRDPFEGSKTPARLAVPKGSCVFVCESPDHDSI